MHNTPVSLHRMRIHAPEAPLLLVARRIQDDEIQAGEMTRSSALLHQPRWSPL